MSCGDPAQVTGGADPDDTDDGKNKLRSLCRPGLAIIKVVRKNALVGSILSS